MTDISKTGSKYQYRCINDNTCKPAESETALYDYVGAVYGEEGKVQYDGQLTVDERKYIEEKFGKLTNPAGQNSYLTHARQIFWQTLSPTALQDADPLCSDPFEFHRFTNKTLGDGIVIGGTHLCEETYGKIYASNGAELEIASNPNNWFFLIEGETKSNNPENILFSRIAKTLQNPIEDPIVAVSSFAVLTEAVKRSQGKISKMDFIVSITLKTWETANEMTHSRSPQGALDYIIDRISSIVTTGGTPINPARLRQALEERLTPPASIPPSIYVTQQREQATNQLKLLVDISNDLSVEHINSLIKKKGLHHVFFLVGQLHVPIVTSLYQPPPQKKK